MSSQPEAILETVGALSKYSQGALPTSVHKLGPLSGDFLRCHCNSPIFVLGEGGCGHCDILVKTALGHRVCGGPLLARGPKELPALPVHQVCTSVSEVRVLRVVAKTEY